MKEMPQGYEDACMTEKAIQRKRGISEPEDLMMLSLFHLLNGCSLTEISVIAELTKLGKVSDVAFMKRFENCNNWFRWIISGLATGGAVTYQKPSWLEGYNVHAVDATDVSEKGRSGRIYRLHFALDLFKMESRQYNITTNATGETLCNFEVAPCDLFIADRAYSTLRSVEHCLAGDGDFILRLRSNSFKLRDNAGETVDLLYRLKLLDEGETLDLDTFAASSENKKIPIRVCAKRKTDDVIAQLGKKMHRIETKKQYKVTEYAREFNEYIVVVTSLPEEIAAEQILEAYKLRWQAEIYFKRLKTIMDFGELPKRRGGSVMAWLNGKLMVALLIEKIIGKADFSPV